MKKLLLFVSISLVAFTAFSQSRYLDEVFLNVHRSANVEYGQNYGFLTGAPLLQPLVMDVYEPESDWVQNRPVIVYLHTGSFLPILFNGTTTGDMHDSATVEMCMQFARRGYVAISMDYRTGWNPLATGPSGQDIRTGTLLQAVFRSLQDTKTCLRYLTMTAKDLGNPWRIDTNSFILGGQGSGGYIALAAATLKDLIQIEQSSKFIATTTAAQYGIYENQPYVIGDIWGDVNGFGGVDTLNHENWPGYTNDIHFVFNMGGAIGDSSWLEAGDAPMVCFHVPSDPFAPYGYGPVIVPTTGQFVVDVSGSHDVIRRADYLGNNLSFNLPFTDPYTTRANQVNEGLYGLFPFVLPGYQAGPWEWWNLTALQNLAIAFGLGAAYADTINAHSLITNPDMSKTKALHYIDSVQGYLNPRMAVTLNLDTEHLDIGIPQVDLGNDIRIFPNPANDYFTLQFNGTAELIKYIKVFDLTGRLMMEISNINAPLVKISRQNLAEGFYMVKIGLNDRELSKKLLFQ